MECPIVGLAVVVARLIFDRYDSSPSETGQASLQTARTGLLDIRRSIRQSHVSSSANAPAALTAPGGQNFRRASALRVSVMMGRHALNVFGQQITRCQAADVAETKDADHPLVLVDHWQPPNL